MIVTRWNFLDNESEVLTGKVTPNDWLMQRLAINDAEEEEMSANKSSSNEDGTTTTNINNNNSQRVKTFECTICKKNDQGPIVRGM